MNSTFPIQLLGIDFTSAFNYRLMSYYNDSLKEAWINSNTGDLFIIIEDELKGYRQACSIVGYAILFGYLYSQDRINESLEMFLKSKHRLYIDFIFNEYKNVISDKNKNRIKTFYTYLLIDKEMSKMKL